MAHTIFIHSLLARPSLYLGQDDDLIMQARIDAPEYWIETYQPNDADLEMLYEHMIESGRPETLESLVSASVRLVSW